MPPTGRYILDTNILIALLAGEPAALTEAGRAAATFIPTIALGELYYGARKSGRPTENLEVIERLAASAALLPCGPETARRYGEVKAELRAAGLSERRSCDLSRIRPSGLRYPCRYLRQADDATVDE